LFTAGGKKEGRYTDAFPSMFQKEPEQSEGFSGVPGPGNSTNRPDSICDEHAELSLDGLPPGLDSTQDNSIEVNNIVD
jgi:hypothetical protein